MLRRRSAESRCARTPGATLRCSVAGHHLPDRTGRQDLSATRRKRAPRVRAARFRRRPGRRSGPQGGRRTAPCRWTPFRRPAPLRLLSHRRLWAASTLWRWTRMSHDWPRAVSGSSVDQYQAVGAGGTGRGEPGAGRLGHGAQVDAEVAVAEPVEGVLVVAPRGRCDGVPPGRGAVAPGRALTVPWLQARWPRRGARGPARARLGSGGGVRLRGTPVQRISVKIISGRRGRLGSSVRASRAAACSRRRRRAGRPQGRLR
ncbi:hypothetical protein STENM223S_03158 [Streptomyces tendae]